MTGLTRRSQTGPGILVHDRQCPKGRSEAAADTASPTTTARRGSRAAGRSRGEPRRRGCGSGVAAQRRRRHPCRRAVTRVIDVARSYGGCRLPACRSVGWPRIAVCSSGRSSRWARRCARVRRRCASLVLGCVLRRRFGLRASGRLVDTSYREGQEFDSPVGVAGNESSGVTPS